MFKALTRVFGSRNERLVRGYNRYVRAAAALEADLALDLRPPLLRALGA